MGKKKARRRGAKGSAKAAGASGADAAAASGADAGLMVPASHNPPDYNGIKMVLKGASAATPDNAFNAIEEIMRSDAVLQPVADYAARGTLIKCNPAIKTHADREALLKALAEDRIDVLATDHAPHLFEEKDNPYFDAPAGLPLVQHALVSLLDHVSAGHFSLEQLVTKAAHNPADLFGVAERGYIREGYWADLVLVDMDGQTVVDNEPVLAKCGWTPFAGHTFQSRIMSTFVSGQLAYHGGKLSQGCIGQALTYDRERGR